MELKEKQIEVVFSPKKIYIFANRKNNSLPHRVCLLSHSQGTADLRRPAPVHDPVVPHEVPDHAQRVVHRTLRLRHDHLVASSGELREGLRTGNNFFFQG